MKNKFTNLSAIVTSLAISSLALPAYADDICSKGDIPASVKEAAGCNVGSTSVTTVIVNIVNTIIGVLGIVAVIFIVIGGVQYMTSAGDPGKAKKAKDTILYACIGLVVAALAFAITNFAINIINNS